MIRHRNPSQKEAFMSIAQMLLPEFDNEIKNTRKLLECMPEGKYDYKPHEKSMTLGRLAGHVAEIPSYATATIRLEKLEMKGGQKPFSPTSKKELLETFEKHAAEARAAIAGASDEDLAKIWSLDYEGKEVFSMPRIAVLRGMMMNHLIHHRAQLGVYLRMNNVEFPGMYGPSADEMKQFQAQGA
jgi:uncharacterized damage-inducible protein DinB